MRGPGIFRWVCWAQAVCTYSGAAFICTSEHFPHLMSGPREGNMQVHLIMGWRRVETWRSVIYSQDFQNIYLSGRSVCFKPGTTEWASSHLAVELVVEEHGQWRGENSA